MAPSPQRPAPTSTAGIVLWRRAARSSEGRVGIDILLVHPGGPFWAKKDEHAWSIPKGEFDPNTETASDAAAREFAEELGQPVPKGELLALDPFRAGKKRLSAFALEADFDTSVIQPGDTHRGMVELEWPPRSGQIQQFPEVDRAAWIDLTNATEKLHKGQAPLIEQLQSALRG